MVRCIGNEDSYTFELSPGLSVRELAAQVAAASSQPRGSHVRLMSGGRELRHHELATVIRSEYVNYVVGCESGPSSARSSLDFPRGAAAAALSEGSGAPALADPDPVEPQVAWGEASVFIDPCGILLAAVGVLLGICWVVFLLQPKLFEGGGRTMLATMTVVFLLPPLCQWTAATLSRLPLAYNCRQFA